MLRSILDFLAAQHKAKLDRWTRLMREVDELLAFGRLSETTRQELRDGREALQQHAREWMT